MRNIFYRSTLVVLTTLLVGSSTLFAADAPTMFPFVIEKGAPDNISNVRTWDAPLPAADSQGILAAENGRFVSESGPIRLLGTNLCFSASFPNKEKAERLAQTLGRFGVCVVRLHHMDSRDIWGKNAERTLNEIDPDQLDKLDYLIAQLRKYGVYVNINLHVSRAFDARDGFENADKLPTQCKGVDNFDRRMIEFQKKYARDLLTHVNPYTGFAYVDDPGVAVIEINNENSVVASWSWGELDPLPEPYAGEFRTLWNNFLLKKYGSTEKLRAAWDARDYPLGPDMIGGVFPLDFQFKNDWELQLDSQSKTAWKIVPASETGIDANALRLDVETLGAQSWIPQTHRVNLTLEAGKPYRVAFKIRSENSAKINVGVIENHDPWSEIGFRREIEATPDWQDVEIRFIASRSDDRVRLSFSSFEAGDSVEIAALSMNEGGRVGIADDETLETNSVPLLHRNGADSTLLGAKALEDFGLFLHDLENDYWQEMFAFVKNDLGARQPVAGTQLQYGYWHNQARLDFCDIHAYWNHPVFPRRSWDSTDWYVDGTALANSPDSGTVANLASLRVLGRPFTCSEYDHPYPNPYCAEGNVMLASIAAFQDWSAIYQFAWSHSDDYERDDISNFFDMCANPAKIAHLPACYGAFVRGDVKSGPGEFVYAPAATEEEETKITGATLTGYHRSLQGLNLDKSLSLAVFSGIELSDLNLSAPGVGNAKKISSWADLPARFGSKEGKEIVNEFGEIRWNFQTEGRGYFVVDAPNCKIFSGFVDAPIEFDNLTLTIGPTELGWATVSLVKGTNVDRDAQKTGAPSPGRYLLAATGAQRNTDAVVKTLENGAVTTASRFGGSSGGAPALCEGVPATIVLKNVDAKNVEVFALDQRGDRVRSLTVENVDGGARFAFGPEEKTLWYEIVVK